LRAILGLDVGTTATKALLITVDGEVIGYGHYPYDMLRVREHGYEQDPEEFWKGTVSATRQALSKFEPGVKVLAIALSTQAGTTIPLGRDNRPVCNGISWMDYRGYRYTGELTDRYSSDLLYEKCGWRLTPASSIMHIIRLRREEPELFSGVHRIAFVNDYLIYRLTGRFCMDPSNAGITELYNVREADWDGELLNFAGVNYHRLSKIIQSGTPLGNLTEESANALGLSQDTVVVNGAHDQYCAALGVGVCKPGDVLVSTGTAWVVLKVFSDIESAFQTGMAVSSYPLTELYGALNSAGAVGKGMGWFSDKILESMKFADPDGWIERAVAESPVGANGLIFISPAVARRDNVVSGFINIDINHSLCDMVRAIMEGAVYEVKRLSENLMKNGVPFSRVIMAGRPAENQMWAQMLSDVLETPVEVPRVREAASFGAAILAGLGVGVFKQADEFTATEQTLRYEPSSLRSSRYREVFDEYMNTLNQCRRDKGF
jgi:sugar (pentulose or hexulose) kinase